MKKRMLSLLLCLCMAVTLLPATAWAAGEETPEETPTLSGADGGIKWAYEYNSGNGVLTISVNDKEADSTKRGGMSNYIGPAQLSGGKCAPWIDELKAGVGDEDDYPLNKVVIADGVKNIGEYAFSSMTMKEVEIAESVTIINPHAFSGCPNLSVINIPSHVTNIKWETFQGCTGMTEIVIPNTVERIEARAFKESGLTSVTIPEGVISIGEQAFAWCRSLQEVSVPASVAVAGMGDEVFYGCSALTKATLACFSTGNSAFANCEKLSDVILKDGLKAVGSRAFSGCSSLTALEFPATLVNITDSQAGVNLFAKCTALEDISYRGTEEQWAKVQCSVNSFTTVDGTTIPVRFLGGGTTDPDNPNPDNPNPDTPDVPDTPDTSATSGSCGESVTWSLSEDGLLTISGAGAMAELTNGQSYGWASQSAKIKQVVITDGVTTVGNEAFAGCANLTRVTIPGSVSTVGAAAFQNCTGLTSVTIPEGVETLYDAVFFGCTKLTQVSLPKSLKKIQYDVFLGTSLKTVNYAGTKSEWAAIQIAEPTSSSDPLPSAAVICTDGSTSVQVVETFTASRNHFNPPGGVTVLTYKNTDPAAFAAKKDKITLTCSVHHYDAVGESENFPVGEPVIGTDTMVWTVTIPENTIDYAVDYTFDCMIHDDENNTDNPFGQIIVSVVARTASIYVPVESVAVSPKTASVNVGGTVALRAAVSPIDVSWHADQWTSSNTDVATVSEEGVVTGVSAGTATITFSASTSCQDETEKVVTVTKSDACTVTVSAVSGGGSHGGGSTSRPSSSGSSHTSTTTTKNPDGSTTTKTENKSTGTVTETTKTPDGSQTVVETKKDGTVTTTETDKAGNKTQTVENPDDSTVTTVTQKDGAATTVSTDASGKVKAEVTLPKAAVSAAQSGGEAVTLPIPEVRATKNTGTAPAVTVKTGSSQPVKVEIPTANTTPGTVAVIVKADGSEEIVKTSVPTDSGVAVSLPDGATVKIVDNSKSFVDVPASSWAADAVSFSSARELFGGTSETTFTPEAPMTRAMMVTVLARFDGADTSGGSTWYQKGVDWAVAKGVSNGSDPNGSITREQLATMLWRYSGSPVSSGTLDGFTDASQVSDYAQEAMRWAVENGIISGYGNGQLGPRGNATRAQVAQMLKNFIEK